MILIRNSIFAPYQISMSSHLEKVVQYYEETQFDYNTAWLTDKNLAIHFGFYDEHANSHSEAVLNTNRFMAEAVGVTKGDTILDAGCGVGGAAFWLSQKRGAIVTGITPVAHQVETCKEKSNQLGLKNKTNFYLADFTDTPFKAGSFDIVWVCESICHARDKAAFYSEAMRLLRPGGKLVMAEYMRFKRPNPFQTEKKMIRGFTGWAIPDICSADEHFNMAAEVGFENILIKDCSCFVRVSFRNVLRHCKRWASLGKVLKSIGIRSKVQHQNLMGTIDICETFMQGAWFYGLLIGVKN